MTKTRFLDKIKRCIDRQKKRNRDGDPFGKRDEYWMLRGVYRSHRFMQATQVRFVCFDLNDRLRCLDQQLLVLADELNIPNRYRDWKLD